MLELNLKLYAFCSSSSSPFHLFCHLSTRVRCSVEQQEARVNNSHSCLAPRQRRDAPWEEKRGFRRTRPGRWYSVGVPCGPQTGAGLSLSRLCLPRVTTARGMDGERRLNRAAAASLTNHGRVVRVWSVSAPRAAADAGCGLPACPRHHDTGLSSSTSTQPLFSNLRQATRRLSWHSPDVRFKIKSAHRLLLKYVSKA